MITKKVSNYKVTTDGNTADGQINDHIEVLGNDQNTSGA